MEIDETRWAHGKHMEEADCSFSCSRCIANEIFSNPENFTPDILYQIYEETACYLWNG